MNEAGPELDALVAEKVMGDEGQLSWNVMNPDESSSAYRGDSKEDCEQFLSRILSSVPDSWIKDYHVGSWRFYPRYSKDIAAAWTVVAKLRERDFLFAAIQFETPSWEVEFHAKTKALLPGNGIIGHGNTAELAICRAALAVAETGFGVIDARQIK